MSVPKRQLIIAALALAVIGGGSWLFLRRPVAMVYEGKTSREWALRLLSSDVATRDQAAAAFKAMGPQVVPDLRLLLQTRDSFFRKPVWLAAEQMPSRQRREVLAKTGKFEANTVRRSAARALGILGPAAEPAIPGLARLLRSPQYELRWEASAALGSIGKAAVPELVRAVGDTNFEIIQPAIAGLGNMGPDAEASIPTLRLAMDFPHFVVRTMAAYSLSAIGIAALPTLMDAAENGSAIARLAAVQGLEKSEPALRNSVPALIRLARAADPAHRRCAVKALGRIRADSEEAIAAMVDALNDPAAAVRMAGIEALGRVPRRAVPAVPRLTKCLSDESGEIRQLSAGVLGRIGAPANIATAELTTLLNDPLEPVRATAKEALTRLSPAEPPSQK
ncbi:MAG TPA: HEAT repeat domain-containing protein [Verrucomicrobiae bacterium]